ncbi:MAG: hypothetical protein ACE5KA_00960 [Nitrososphaerales archaeon]
MSSKANQVSRLELFLEIVKAFELQANVTEEIKGLTVDVSKDELSLKVIFGDFKKVRIWKKFAFAPTNIMEEYRRAEELLKPLAHAFNIEWHVLKKKIATKWPLESQTDQNFLLEIVLDNLEKDQEFLKNLLADENRNYFVRKSIPYMINDWPEFTKQKSSKLLKLLDEVAK